MRLLPERRQHLRIVTLKNAAWLLGGLIVLFIALSVWNELRPGDPTRGVLYRGSDGATPAPSPRPATTSDEPPITDRTFAVRDGGYPLAPQPPPPPPVVAAERPRPGTLKQARERGDRIVITGGPEGVRTEAKPGPATATETVPPDRF